MLHSVDWARVPCSAASAAIHMHQQIVIDEDSTRKKKDVLSASVAYSRLARAHFPQTTGQKWCAASVLCVRTCLSPAIVLALVVGVWLIVWGAQLARLEADEKPALLQPFERVDRAIEDGVAQLNRMPATFVNFTFDVGWEAATALDRTAVATINVLPETVLIVMSGILSGFYDATNLFVTWINTQRLGLPPARAVPLIDEERLVSDVLKLQVSLSEFLVVRNAFSKIAMPNATTLGLPRAQFRSAALADDVLSAGFAVTNELAIVMLVIGGLLVLLVVTQVAAQMARPFSTRQPCVRANKLLVAVLRPRHHVPLVLGAALIALGVVLLDASDTMRGGALEPLRAADAEIAAALNAANAWIERLPNAAVNAVNNRLSSVDVTREVGHAVLRVLSDAHNTLVSKIELVLNQFLAQTQLCATACVAIARIDLVKDDGARVTLSTATWFLKIPSVKFDALPLDLISLERALSPPIDALHAFLTALANRLVVVGVLCVVVPLGLIVVATVDVMAVLPLAWRTLLDVSDLDGQRDDGGDALSDKHGANSSARAVRMRQLAGDFVSTRTVRFDDVGASTRPESPREDIASTLLNAPSRTQS